MSDAPTFAIEHETVGLGYCVVAQWLDGRRETVAGFGNERQAARWIEVDSAKRLLSILKRIQGVQWVNNHLPKAE